ncbi:hypothetical protein Hanom_Chr10g00908241 [Helianthus anomalus]
MTKMVTRSSPNKDQDHGSPPKSQDLLKTPSSELCHANAVESVYTLEQIIRDEGLNFNFSELSRLYNLVSHGSQRVLFKAKPQQPPPLLKTTKNDTCWRNQFFFVRETLFL